MLKTLFNIFLPFVFFTITGCRNQPVVGKTNTATATKNDCSQVIDSVQRVLVRYTDARKYMQSYDSLCRTHKDYNPIKAYTIRAIDLLAALGMPPSYVDSPFCRFKHIRVYLGYKNTVGFKLLIMPVENACLQGEPSKWKGGNDVLLDKYGNPAMRNFSPSGIETDDTYLLDLNAPCPNTCPQQPETRP